MKVMPNKWAHVLRLQYQALLYWETPFQGVCTVGVFAAIRLGEIISIMLCTAFWLASRNTLIP
jgi:hypothetical protein